MESLGEEKRRLIERFTKSHRALLESCAQEEARLALNVALNSTKPSAAAQEELWGKVLDLLESIHRTAVMRVCAELIRGPEHIRLATYHAMRESWINGVSYRLSDMPEMRGYAHLLSRITILTEEKICSFIIRFARLGLLTPHEISISDSEWSLESYWLARSADHRKLIILRDTISGIIGVELRQLSSLISAALWIQEMETTADEAVIENYCPCSKLILELLSSSWFRGIRRKSSRDRGASDRLRSSSIREVSVPNCLTLRADMTETAEDIALYEEINLRLAPLRLEWLSALSRSISKDEPMKYLFTELGTSKWRELKAGLSQQTPREIVELCAWLEELMPAHLYNGVVRTQISADLNEG
jgi:hypothetical protein